MKLKYVCIIFNIWKLVITTLIPAAYKMYTTICTGYSSNEVEWILFDDVQWRKLVCGEGKGGRGWQCQALMPWESINFWVVAERGNVKQSQIHTRYFDHLLHVYLATLLSNLTTEITHSLLGCIFTSPFLVVG